MGVIRLTFKYNHSKQHLTINDNDLESCHLMVFSTIHLNRKIKVHMVSVFKIIYENNFFK